jgi:CO/xanthine dehydrogenase FAD-binding subunit
MLKISAYHRPATLTEAASLLADEGRTIIAGGTDLLVNPRYMRGIREVIDIQRLGLDYIVVEPGWLRIGAGTTMRQVALHPLIQKLANGILARSAAVCASPNIRNMATLVGNVASALPSADTPPALLALDAQVVLLSSLGERVVPLRRFFTGPAQSIREHELIRELRLPLQPIVPPDRRGGFYKVGRSADDISLVNAAVTLTIRDGTITSARLVLGAVAPIPLHCQQAEQALLKQAVSEATFERVAELVRAEVSPISDQRASAEYRRHISGIAALRALRQAAGQAPQGEEWHHA